MRWQDIKDHDERFKRLSKLEEARRAGKHPYTPKQNNIRALNFARGNYGRAKGFAKHMLTLQLLTAGEFETICHILEEAELRTLGPK